MSPRETADLLVKYGVIPVIRYNSADDGALAITAALAAGFPTVEITLSMPDAVELVREFSKRAEKHQVIGAGTIWNEADAERVLQAGAHYLVSPGLVPGLGEVVHAGNAAYLPGALTPGEIAACIRDGADIVKIFPASSVGLGHLKAVKAVFPDTRFCPTGSISKDNMDEWFNAGSSCVGIGNTLFSAAAMKERNQNKLIQEARLILDYLKLITR